MNPERWRAIHDILQDALTHVPAERPAFLAQACAEDDLLREEVESLLAHHEQAGSFLEASLPQVAAELLVGGQASLADGQTIGHYRVIAPLGAGGMGEVYLAQDTILDRKIAIKIMPTRFTRDPARSLRFEQEARAASALNHPNIVTIYEIGQSDGIRFMATEFIDGQTLGQRMTGTRMTLMEALDVASQAAYALAAAHEAGIVHRDIKPDNIMLRRDGYIKVLDFGLAKLIEHNGSADADDAHTMPRDESRTNPGMVLGTAYYMSPEQARGLEVDTRSDIFSLGVILFEMIAGCRPFEGATTSDVIAAILVKDPLLSGTGQEIPAELERIIRKALAKNREERYQTVKDLLHDMRNLKRQSKSKTEAVCQCTASQSNGGSRAALGDPLPPPPILAAPNTGMEFLGREAERAQMTRIWECVRIHRKQVMLIEGEPGIGKTRLALEFARSRLQEGVSVLVGRCEQEALVPYQPIIEALRWYVRTCPRGDLKYQFDAIGSGAELAQLCPDLSTLFPDLPAIQMADAEGQRYRMFVALSDLLAVASRIRPLLLIIDDLHWADKSSLLLFRHLVRTQEESSLGIIGIYRETEFDRTHAFPELLADLCRDPAVTRIALQGLGEADVQGLIKSCIGRDAPPGFARLVADRTSGNPFFIGEVLRHMDDTGALARLDSQRFFDRASDLGLPEGVNEVIGHRLSRLSESCYRVLSLAAVIGREFALDVLARLAAIPEDHLLDLLDEAMAARLIVEAPGVVDRFSFIHALIRESLYRKLSSPRRVRWHRRVADVLERFYAENPEPALGDLAYHFTQAACRNLADKAVSYAILAAEKATKALAHEESARFLGMGLQALEFKHPGPATEALHVDLHTRRGRAYGSIGQWALARPEFEVALEHLEPGRKEGRCELLLDLAATCFWLLDLAPVSRCASEGLGIAEYLSRDDLAAEALSWLARSKQALDGDLFGAIQLDRQARQRVRGAPTKRYRTASANAALSFYLVGEMDEAVRLAAELANLARGENDTSFTMNALPVYGLSLAGRGRYNEAETVFAEARDFGRRYGVWPHLARTSAMAAGFHLDLFDFEGAETLQQEARELGQRVNFAPPVVSAGIDLMLNFIRRGEPGGVEPLLQPVLAAIHDAGGWHGWLWRIRVKQVEAELALARGQFECALQAASETIERAQTAGRRKYQVLGLVARGEALTRLGRWQEAGADLRRGVEIAREMRDPAIHVRALASLMPVDGSDALATEAQSSIDCILNSLTDVQLRSRFLESDVVTSLLRRAQNRCQSTISPISQRSSFPNHNLKISEK